RDHGRHPDSLLLQRAHRGRHGACRGDAAHLPHADAPGAHDLHGRLCGSGARGALEQHRRAGAAAARDRGGRRHPAGTGTDPAGDAGADPAGLAPPPPRRGGGHERRAARRGRLMSVRRSPGAVVGALLLTACAVGPDFHPPAPPAVQEYGAPGARSASPTVGDEPQQFHSGARVPERWWEALGSGQIDALVDQVLAANPDIQGGQAALRAALESAAAARGALWPGLQASYQGERRQDSGTLSPTVDSAAPIFTLHTAEVDLSYTLDVFGGNRRTVEALASTAEAQRFELEATRLTLVSNAIVAVVNQAAAQAQIAAMQRIVQEERAALEILRRQYALGSVSLATVGAQEAILSQAEAALPGLEQQRAQQQDLLAALSGRAPSQLASLDVELSALTLPRTL